MNKTKMNKFFDNLYTTFLKLVFFFSAVYFSTTFWACLFQSIRENKLSVFIISLMALFLTSVVIGLTWIFEWYSIEEEKKAD